MSDLTRELSTALQRELGGRLLAGETVLISLPGSAGEALVVSDKRVLVLRERIMGLDPVVDAFIYPLGAVRGAKAFSSQSGGYIELKLAEPVTDPDSARVYFPSYDEAAFTAAAAQLSRDASAPGSEPVMAPVTQQAGTVCTKCGTSVGPRDIFCSQCGAQLTAICLSCGGPTPVGSKYCASCGRQFLEFLPCVKCGTRVGRAMAFCPECGSMLRAVCMGCGTQVLPDWKYCAACGRLLNSQNVDPRATAAVQALRQWAAERQPSPASDDGTDAPAPPPNSAEAHNRRGKELFNEDDYEAAAREFGIAVTMEPNNGSYHCNLALALDELDRDAEAFNEYQKALQLNPNDTTALLYLGYMHSENDEPDQARQAWQRVIAIAPDSAEAQEARQNLTHQEQL